MSKQDQDAAMERWLREALAARDRTAASECLDAETLAAWSEGALGGSERSFAEAHAARCARCQAMLAAMARSVPEQPVPSSAIRKWVLMLSPAVAAAAAVALWFAVERRPTITLPQPTSPAPSESAASAPQVQTAPTAPAAGFEAKAEADKEAERPSSSQVRRKGQALPIDRVASTRQEAAKASTASRSPAPAAPAPPPAPPAPLPSVAEAVPVQNTAVQAQTPQVQTPQGQTAQTQQPSTDLQTVPRAAPEPKRQSDPRFRAAARADGLRDEVREGLDLVSIVSPGGAVRWRVLRGRIVEHSSDGGANWATQYTATDNAVLLSGAAPSSTVAWLVGRAGMVLVTTDGRTWQRVGFPEAVDLVIVTATDARTATVTTADNRRFITTNSGQTWIQR